MSAEEVTIEIGEVITKAPQNDLTVRVILPISQAFCVTLAALLTSFLKRSNTTISDINRKTKQVADAVVEAGAAVRQVSGGVRTENTAVGQVSQALAESANAIGLASTSANTANIKR